MGARDISLPDPMPLLEDLKKCYEELSLGWDVTMVQAAMNHFRPAVHPDDFPEPVSGKVINEVKGKPSFIQRQSEEREEQERMHEENHPLGSPIMADPPSPQRKPRTNAPWTPAEEKRLQNMRDAGHSWAAIAKVFVP